MHRQASLASLTPLRLLPTLAASDRHTRNHDGLSMDVAAVLMPLPAVTVAATFAVAAIAVAVIAAAAVTVVAA